MSAFDDQLKEALERSLQVPVFTGTPIEGLTDEEAEAQDRDRFPQASPMPISDEAVEAGVASLIEAMSQERGFESPYVDAEYPKDAVIDGVFDLPAIVRAVLEAVEEAQPRG